MSGSISYFLMFLGVRDARRDEKNCDYSKIGRKELRLMPNFDENHKIANKNIKGVKSEKIKIKTRFCDKDLSSLDSIN